MYFMPSLATYAKSKTVLDLTKCHFCLGTGVPRHSAGGMYVHTSSEPRAETTWIKLLRPSHTPSN